MRWSKTVLAESPLLNATEAAELLRLNGNHKRILARLRRTGRIVGIRPSKEIVYPREALLNYIHNEQERNPK